MIPDFAKDIYPNHVQHICGKPSFIFRDHRWTLPVLKIAADRQLLKLPVKVVTFDRHKDSLPPRNGTEALEKFRSGGGTLDDLIDIVANRLSARDDDWIVSGMELGLISDVVQFGSSEEESDSASTVWIFEDSAGEKHNIYYLGRPVSELSYKGALDDKSHDAASAGLWDVLGWNPARPGIAESPGEFIFDIDLDFFTFTWEKYTFPFTKEVYEGEFLSLCQSRFYDEYQPTEFVGELMKHAALITVACEPSFCGGPLKARKILKDINDLFFEKSLNIDSIEVDYKPVYPDE
ncbi:hypothetical protein ACFL2X_02300 [Candidatus Latescibacterota bacterium]